MGETTVDQILVTPLRRIALPEGDVMHGMKCADPGFRGFGEAYFSQVRKGAVKAWKRHLRMTLNIVVPLGRIAFVFVDDRGSRREEIVGPERYVRLTVPPGLWFGFTGLSEPYGLLLNLADIPHDPGEVERKAITDIEHDWRLVE